MLLCGVSAEALRPVCGGEAAAGGAGGLCRADFTAVSPLSCQKALARIAEQIPASLAWRCLPAGRWQTDDLQLQRILCIRVRKCFDQAPN